MVTRKQTEYAAADFNLAGNGDETAAFQIVRRDFPLPRPLLLNSSDSTSAYGLTPPRCLLPNSIPNSVPIAIGFSSA